MAGSDSLYGDAGDDTAIGGQGFDAACADLDVCKADPGDFLIDCP